MSTTYRIWMTASTLLVILGIGCAIQNPHVTQHLAVGTSHLEHGHAAAAEESLRAVLLADPSNIAAHYEMGRLEALRGNAAQARTHFETVLVKQPYNASATVNLAWALYQLNDLETAANYFKRTIQLADEEESANTGLGAVALARHQPEEAKNYFDSVLTKNPESPLAHYYTGEFYEQKGDWARAIEHYKECAHHEHDNPMHAQAYYKLACCYMELKRDEAGLNALQQAARFGFRRYDLVAADARFKKHESQVDDIRSGSDSGGDSGGDGGHSGH